MIELKKLTIGFIRLSRIKVILKDYFWAVTIVSIIAAGLNLHLLEYILAIFVTLSVHIYAFIVNDCEDADDDAMDPKKAKRNPISSGFLTYREGILLLQLASFPALIVSYFNAGWKGFALIVLALLAGHLYSWKRVRFKNMPFIDIASHAFALSMFNVIYFMLLPGAVISLGSILIVYGAGFFSAGGALYNQLRDFEVDQKSGLNNTTNVIGYKKSQRLATFLYGLGLILTVIGCIMRFI